MSNRKSIRQDRLLRGLCRDCGESERDGRSIIRCTVCLEKNNAYNKKRDPTTSNKTLVKDFKSKPCTDCHKTYPQEIMECDHVRGTKLFTIGTGMHFSRSRLKAELEKCDVRCPTCHKLRHLRDGTLHV